MALQHYLIAATASLGYVAALVMYRLIFHPLARFPGPKLAAATGWYLAYFDIMAGPGAQVMFELHRLHRLYGPIVRISPDEIHIDDYTWLDTLYTVTSGGHRDKHLPDAVIVGTPFAIFGTEKHDIHRKRRQAFAGIFSKANVARVETMVWDKMEKLLNNMNQEIKQHGHASMRVHTLAMTTDVAAAYCLEESLGLQDDESKARNWSEVQASVPDIIPIARHFTWIIPLSLSIPMWILAKYDPKLVRVLSIRTEAERQAKNAISQYEKNPEDTLPEHQNNIFRTIIASPRLPDSEKSYVRIGEEAWGVLVAGGDTAARTIANITFFLLEHRHTVLERLRRELAGVMPSPTSRPAFRDLENLPLLTAVIKETLRTHGPVTSRLPRVSPHEDLQYKEWNIPAGTPVSMSPGDIMHDPRIFENPDKWDPDRWMITDKDKLDLMNHNLIPFGRGGRMCVGQNLAWLELYVAVAALARFTDYELFETTRQHDVDYVRDCLLGQPEAQSKGIRIQLRK
ncbi:cytochrome p450 domain-containing protein [Sarocladium implicatum]|nr:cytochrome p450 domain-containing protein [Sarocladium implicatum]